MLVSTRSAPTGETIGDEHPLFKAQRGMCVNGVGVGVGVGAEITLPPGVESGAESELIHRGRLCANAPNKYRRPCGGAGRNSY